MPKFRNKDGGVSILAKVIAIICVIALVGASIYIITKPAEKPAVREVHSLSISAQSPVTASQSSAITVQAHDAQGNPVSGANVSLVAQAMENQFAGDYEVELPLTDLENGTYTSSLASQWAGTYRLTASVGDISARENVVFEPGPLADIVATATSPTPASSSYKSTVSFYFADNYGNSLPPTRIQPIISLPAGWSMENLMTSYTGESFFDVFVNIWDNRDITVADNITGLSENFNVVFPPLYTEVEQDLSPTSVELISPSPENVGARATWGDNELSLKVGVFFPAMSELGWYEITFSYDSSALHLIRARDWCIEDGFPAPMLTILSENSFKISQDGSAPPGGVNLAIVDFEPLKTGETTVTATNLELSKVEYQPVYDKEGNIIYYEKIYVPIKIPTPFGTHIIILKPLKRLIVPMKFFTVENSGLTDADARRVAEREENTLNKAAKDCKLNYWFVVIAEINHISKDNWSRYVGADNKFTDNEMENTVIRAENWGPRWINVYLVPPCSAADNSIGTWYGGSIASDLSKDTHNRNLAHELIHEFSRSRVLDGPDTAGAEARRQGARNPNNIMRYCGGGREISAEQGRIINEELDKRAEPYDADGDGRPEGYIYRPDRP